MANHWLLKTEPSVYSFQQLQKDKRTVWDGVKNDLALKHLARGSPAIRLSHMEQRRSEGSRNTAFGSEQLDEPAQKLVSSTDAGLKSDSSPVSPRPGDKRSFRFRWGVWIILGVG